MLLSFYVGLKIVSVYSLYNSLIQIINQALSSLSNSITFVLGQEFHTNKNRFMKIYDIYELYYITLTFSICTIVNIFLIPFIKIYTKGVIDINYVDSTLGLMFIIIILLVMSRTPSGQVINVAGHFKETRVPSILESVINLGVSLVTVNYFGIYGILLGTIAALLYRSNNMIIYANVKILKISPLKTYSRLIINTVLFILATIISKRYSITATTYGGIIGLAAIYTVIIVPFFFLVASLLNLKTFKSALSLIKSFIITRKEVKY